MKFGGKLLEQKKRDYRYIEKLTNINLTQGITDIKFIWQGFLRNDTEL
jgi:hypothetical protein